MPFQRSRALVLIGDRRSTLLLGNTMTMSHPCLKPRRVFRPARSRKGRRPRSGSDSAFDGRVHLTVRRSRALAGPYPRAARRRSSRSGRTLAALVCNARYRTGDASWAPRWSPLLSIQSEAPPTLMFLSEGSLARPPAIPRLPRQSGQRFKTATMPTCRRSAADRPTTTYDQRLELAYPGWLVSSA